MVRRIGLMLFAVIAAVMALRWALASEGLWAAMKPALIPFVQLYLDVFNSPATAILLCVIMVAAAVGLYVYYWSTRVRPVIHDLEVLATQLAATEPRQADDALLAQLDRTMERYPRFSRFWRSYRATLSRDERGRWTSQAPVSGHFDMRMLEAGGMRLRFFYGLPNDFVGLGLVFTFLGLVAGLYFASRSMMSSDLAEARNALVQLLHAATFKFLTSIAGITISIVMSAAQRLMAERLQAGLDAIQALLEQRLPAASTVGFEPRAGAAPSLALAAQA